MIFNATFICPRQRSYHPLDSLNRYFSADFGWIIFMSRIQRCATTIVVAEKKSQ